MSPSSKPMYTSGPIQKPTLTLWWRFSPSSARRPNVRVKWAGMRRALKPGGLLIIQGYTPKQLEFGTGGPKQVENLYARAMLEDAFRGFHDMRIVEEEREIHEGKSHGGMSAVINFTARKP